MTEKASNEPLHMRVLDVVFPLFSICVIASLAVGCCDTNDTTAWSSTIAMLNDGPVRDRYLGRRCLGEDNYTQHLGIWRSQESGEIISFYTTAEDDTEDWMTYLRLEGWIPIKEYVDVYERVKRELGPVPVPGEHSYGTGGRIPVSTAEGPATND